MSWFGPVIQVFQDNVTWLVESHDSRANPTGHDVPQPIVLQGSFVIVVIQGKISSNFYLEIWTDQPGGNMFEGNAT